MREASVPRCLNGGFFTFRIVIGDLVTVSRHMCIPVVSLLEVLDLSWEEDVNDFCLYLVPFLNRLYHHKVPCTERVGTTSQHELKNFMNCTSLYKI